MDDKDRERATQARAIKEVNENWLLHLESAKLGAKLTRAKFDALVKEGFTEAQALFLCKA